MAIKVGIVACSKKKGPTAEAQWLYQGELFRKASAYCRDRMDFWYILSGLHGLLLPTQEVEPYELYLPKQTASYRRQWALTVQEQATKLGLYNLNIDITWLAPTSYYDPLKGLHLHVTDRPLKGLGQGQQLGWFASRGY